MDGGSPRLYEFGEDMGENYETLLRDGVSLPSGYYLAHHRRAAGIRSGQRSPELLQRKRGTDDSATARDAPLP